MPYWSVIHKNVRRWLGLSALFFLMEGCSDNAGQKESDERNWPLFRGDAALSAYTRIRLPEKPALLWSYKSNSRTSSSPVLYDNKVYWCDKRGRIYGVDYEGNTCFGYDFATAVEATPMISDSILYVGRIDGCMSALSLATKDTLWTFETEGQLSASANTGTLAGREILVFGSYDNFLYCLDKQSGKEISKFKSGYYINGAAAVWQHYIFSGGCDAWLRIVDATTGLVSDSLQLDAYIPASPAISDKHCYIADHSGNVYDIVTDKGKIVSHKKVIEATDDQGTFVSVAALSASTLFILSDDRHLYAIDRKSGDLRWKYLQKGNSGESSPVVCNDKIISCSKNGVVSVLDASNGSLLWEYDTGEQLTACPAVIKGRFYILTTKGTLFCFGER